MEGCFAWVVEIRNRGRWSLFDFLIDDIDFGHNISVC